MLLNEGELDGHRYLSRETCKLFTTEVSKISRRGLGFDKPDMKTPDKSPCTKSAPALYMGIPVLQVLVPGSIRIMN